MLRRPIILGAVAAALLALAACARAPSGDAGAADDLKRAAAREGALTIYTNMGDTQVGQLLTSFYRDNPTLRVTFLRQNSADLNDHYLKEAAAGRPSADIIWSSAMDLQIKLINDGYAATYLSPEKPALPTWAVWKNQGYGVTAEPIVFAYDRRRLDPAHAPTTHAALRRMLETGGLPGPVGTFDPERSGVGFLYYSQDRLAWADTLALNRAIGTTRPRLYESTVTLLDAIHKGDAAFGYNVVGSYAMDQQRLDPNLVVVFPQDYTLVMSRIAFISARAPHPNAARRFLDFLLSKEGQTLLREVNLTPVRADVPVDPARRPAPSAVRPIEVGPALLANLDQMRRARLLADWRQSIGPNRTNDFTRVRDNFVTDNRR